MKGRVSKVKSLQNTRSLFKITTVEAELGHISLTRKKRNNGKKRPSWVKREVKAASSVMLHCKSVVQLNLNIMYNSGQEGY